MHENFKKTTKAASIAVKTFLGIITESDKKYFSFYVSSLKITTFLLKYIFEQYSVLPSSFFCKWQYFFLSTVVIFTPLFMAPYKISKVYSHLSNYY